MAAPEAQNNAQPVTPAAGANTSGGSTSTASDFGSWWKILWPPSWNGPLNSSNAPANPLSGALWEHLAAGFETGALALVKDLWDLILGPIEVFIGIGFWVVAFIVIFKNDIVAVAGAVARSA